MSVTICNIKKLHNNWITGLLRITYSPIYNECTVYTLLDYPTETTRTYFLNNVE